MDFLIDEEITVETINNIEDSNEMGLIYNFICQKKNALAVLRFFKKIGITSIDRLLIYKLEIFLVDVEKIKKAFNEYDASVLVQLINEDINAIIFL